MSSISRPNRKLVIEALEALNEAGDCLFSCGGVHWSTHLIDPKTRHDYETEDTTLDVGEVLSVLKARVASMIRRDPKPSPTSEEGGTSKVKEAAGNG